MTVHTFNSTLTLYNLAKDGGAAIGDVLHATDEADYCVIGLASYHAFAVTKERGHLAPCPPTKDLETFIHHYVNPKQLSELKTVIQHHPRAELDAYFVALEPWLMSTYGFSMTSMDEDDGEEDFFQTAVNALGLTTGDQQEQPTPERIAAVQAAVAHFNDAGLHSEDAVSTLISAFDIIDVEGGSQTGLTRGIQLQLLDRIGDALLYEKAKDDRADARANKVYYLRLQQGSFGEFETNAAGVTVPKFTLKGFVTMPDTPYNRMACATIMQISVNDLDFALEDDGECTTNEWWCDLVPHPAEAPAVV